MLVSVLVVVVVVVVVVAVGDFGKAFGSVDTELREIEFQSPVYKNTRHSLDIEGGR